MTPYLVVDTETSGFPRTSVPVDDDLQPHIASLAALLFDADHQPRASLDVIIRPDGWVSHPKALAVHKLDEATATRWGVPEVLALRLFWELAAKVPLIVAHKADFDRDIISCGLARYLAEHLPEWAAKTFACTMRTASAYGEPGALGDLHEAMFGARHAGAHGAMPDCRAAHRVYVEFCRRSVRISTIG